MTEPRRGRVFQPWVAQRTQPATVVDANGSWFVTADGSRFLDVSSQLVFSNVGHRRKELVDAITRQANDLCTLAPFHGSAVRDEAAHKIVEHAPAVMSSVLFTNGGAEANENAVRMARLHTGRSKVLAAYRSYHGATHGAITITGDPRRWPSEPGPPGVVHFFGPYPYRSAFGSDSPVEECERALTHLADVMTFEDPQSIAAVILKPVVGTNGILVPPEGYLAGVRELCDRHGILLIADEVMTGFGRCGEWFAVDRWSVVPDLITFAKGVNSGYVPLGGVIISEPVAATFEDRPYPGGLTYSGHPLACAAAVANIGVLESDDLIVRAREVGEKEIGPRLRELASRHPSVGEVRGLGLFWAIELVTDRATHEPLVRYNATGAANEPMVQVVSEIKRHGVWPFSHFNRLHVVPPLTIDLDEIQVACDGIEAGLKVADQYTSG